MLLNLARINPALPIGAALAAATVITPPPAGLSPDAWRTLGIAVLMAAWWVGEVIPLAATALIPLAIFPLIGTAHIAIVAPAYAHPLILLFLGGFLLAKAMERSGLHRWIALGILGRSGGNPAHVVGGVMLATAFLSLWISNTATAMIMAPIGAAIASGRPDDENFAIAMMLGIAFSATIGGLGSLIGTPPNALFAAYMAETHGVVIGFAEWAMFGLPTAAILLPIAWFLLTRISFPVAETPMDRAALGERDRLSVSARRVAVVAAATAFAWIARPALDLLLPSAGITDAGIAMLAAIALFLTPNGCNGRLLDWNSARTIRWDVLILFGGGLALATQIEATGLALWLGQSVAALKDWPTLAVIAVFAAVIVLLGELASNTAMAAIFLPIAGASAVAFGADPLLFTLPIALAASIGFMLPVATPPNAIVFTHEAVTRKRMLRAGAPLDLIGTVVAITIAYVLAPIVFPP